MNNPIRKNNLAFNRLKDELVIIDFSSDKQFHQLNDVGARIWELCDGANSIDDISIVISSEFDTSPTEALQDTKEFINELSRLQLLDC